MVAPARLDCRGPSSPCGLRRGSLRASFITWLRHAKPARTIGVLVDDIRCGFQPVFAQVGYAGHAWPPATTWLRHAKPKAKRGGARRDRTADLVIANDALSQLSYGPLPRPPRYA